MNLVHKHGGLLSRVYLYEIAVLNFQITFSFIFVPQEGITYANGSMSRVKDQFEKLQVPIYNRNLFELQFQKARQLLLLENT